MRTSPSRGFTLIELLVVISIIVILLALLVGGLERALKAAERAKCATNQRGIANSAAQYALEMDRTFPPATTPAAGWPTTALVVRIAPGAANATQAQDVAAAVGIGYLIVGKRLAGTSSGGEMLHCPTLDTTSATPVNVGMNQDTVTAADGNGTGTNNAVGMAGWKLNNVVVSGYLFRAHSYAITHSGGTIRTNIANSSFALTSDTVNYVGDANRWGRTFHHITGWNVASGDGSCSYIADPEGEFKSNSVATWVADCAWKGYVEREVAKGRIINGGAGNEASPFTNAVGTEDVFKWLGRPTGSNRTGS